MTRPILHAAAILFAAFGIALALPALDPDPAPESARTACAAAVLDTMPPGRGVVWDNRRDWDAREYAAGWRIVAQYRTDEGRGVSTLHRRTCWVGRMSSGRWVGRVLTD